MSILKSIFKRKSTIDNLLDKDNGLLAKIGAHIGNKNFTDEERAEMNKSMADNLNKFVIDTMSESTDRSKTRRAMSVNWINVQLALILLSAYSVFFNPDNFDKIFSLSTSPIMMMGTAAILGFFYGTHLLRAKKGS